MAAVVLAALGIAISSPAPAQLTPGIEHCVTDVTPPGQLNVRSGPSTDFAVRYGLLPAECGVYVTATCSGNWCPIATAGRSPGWAASRYLAAAPEDIVAPLPGTTKPAVKGQPEYFGIAIRGSSAFVTQTIAALGLLRGLAPDAFHKIQTYIGVIQQADITGMVAYAVPPRYEVADETAFYSITWYASTIAHDAVHSELYHRHVADHPGVPVAPDAWTGVSVERFAIGFQLDVSRRIGGPEDEILYLEGQTGDHCDIDSDGDCDWADYQRRNW
ncbi:MAG: hypothetical protein IT534_11360 [Bauldia sp.]|nr:hypothetical protein [Bauldia sp.]